MTQTGSRLTVSAACDSILALTWYKSSRSMPHGDCVEVAATNDFVLVRHSRRSVGPFLTFTRTAWNQFLGGLACGQLDGSPGDADIGGGSS